MSEKHIVLAEVDGEIRILSLISNSPEHRLQELSRTMLEKLLPGGRVKGIRVEPWPSAKSLRRSIFARRPSPAGITG